MALGLAVGAPRAGVAQTAMRRSGEVPRLDAALRREEMRRASGSSGTLRLAVSLRARTLWVIAGADTLRTAPVAVASDEVLMYGGRTWRFTPPRGRRTVQAKRAEPVWRPPDWHYAETAREYALQLRRLPAAGVRLADGRWLQIRDSLVGIAESRRGDFQALPIDEHIIFDSAVFIPPVATRNRQLSGALGPFALDLGDGFLLHGTPDPSTIGTATTHGCMRLYDADIEWLYDHVPVGTSVYVY